MKPLIYYKTSGVFVHPSIYKDWLVKAPTKRNRLAKGGSAGLRMDEKYDLEHNKKGILFIDHSAKCYVYLPKELLTDPVGKSCNGLKNSIFSYNVNALVNGHNLEIVPIPKEDEIQESYEMGLAGQIRERFGL